MQYKTIVLEILRHHPQIHEQLRSKRVLLPTLEFYARRLKTSHEAWKDRLSQATPGSNPGQVASAALEIALKELEDSLNSGFSPCDSEPLSIEEAMAFLRGHARSE